MKQGFYVLMFVVLIGGSCGNSSNQDVVKIKAAEAKLRSAPANQRMDETIANEAIQSYTEYADKHKGDSASAGYLFLAADIMRGIGKSKECLPIYERILKEHPNYSKAATCLFLIGFTYDNDLKNLEKAKEVYQQFLIKYPSHELVKDVQFSLDHLGKSPEDIIKEFELKQKNNVDSTQKKV